VKVRQQQVMEEEKAKTATLNRNGKKETTETHLFQGKPAEDKN